MEYSTQNVSTELRTIINEIIQAINYGEIVIFCGAGISRNSGLPVVNQLVPCILNKLELPEKDIEHILDNNYNPKIPFESFIQGLQHSCEVNEIFNIYDLGVPNTNHLLLAKFIKSGKVKTIVTTNFDKLIEKALGMEPTVLKEGKDYDVISNEQSFEKINWSEDRIRLIKIHGSVDDKESMAITLKQVASQVLSKPREAIIRKVFSEGNHHNVLILGYSSSDVFDISPQIAAIKENHKRVYYIQHSDKLTDAPKVENIQEQNDKNPFKEYKDSWRLFYDTDQLIKGLWESIVNKAESYELKTNKTNWEENVAQWHRLAISEYRESIKFSIPAHIYLQMGELDAAIKYFLQALESTKDIDDKTEEQVCLGNLGNVYMSKGEYDKAIEYSEQALELARKIGDKKREGSWLGSLGNSYLKKRIYVKAIEYYEQALRSIRENGDKQREGTWLGNLGITYYNMGDYSKAIKYSKEALKIDKEVGDKEGEGAMLINIGNVYSHKEEYIKAKSNLEKAIKIADDIGNKRWKGANLGILGNIHYRMGEYVKAKEYYEKALTIAEDIGDKSNVGSWLGNLGVYYRNMGDYGKAIEYHERSLKLAEEIGDKKGEGASLSNIGVIHKKNKDYNKAKEYHEKALKIAVDIGDKKGKAVNLGNLGIIYMNKGEYIKAKEYYEDALTLAKELDDKLSEAICLSNIGKNFNNIREYDKAIEYSEQALFIIKQLLGSDHPHTISFEKNLRIISSKAK